MKRALCWASAVLVLIAASGTATAAPIRPETASADTSIISVGAESSNGELSRSARWVAFESNLSLLAEDVNDRRDVYVKDLVTGEVVLASVRPSGQQPDQTSSLHDLSANGQVVAFSTSDGEFLPHALRDPKDFRSQLYLRDLQSGKVTLVTRATDGSPGEYGGWGSLDNDGDRVAFRGGSGFVPGVNPEWPQVYVAHIGGRFRLASHAQNGLPGDRSSQAPSLSGTGRYVAYGSIAENLIADDQTPALPKLSNYLHGTDVYLTDLRTGTVTLVSANTAGKQLSRGMDPQLSTDASAVLFEGRRVDPTDTAKRVLYKELTTGRLRVLLDGHGEPGGISGTGDVVVFNTKEQLDPTDVEHDADATALLVTAGGVQTLWSTTSLPRTDLGHLSPRTDPELSADGQSACFTWFTALTPSDPDGVPVVQIAQLM